VYHVARRRRLGGHAACVSPCARKREQGGAHQRDRWLSFVASLAVVAALVAWSFQHEARRAWAELVAWRPISGIALVVPFDLAGLTSRGFVDKTLSDLLETASVPTLRALAALAALLGLRAHLSGPGNLTPLPQLFRSTRPTESLLCGQSENSGCDCR
jgi:hypothetical protein